MTPLIVTAALSILALDAAPATTAPAPAAVAPVTVNSPPKADVTDDNKVICHREAVTGSRFEKKICYTRAQLREVDRQNEEMSRRFSEAAARNAAGATGGGMSGTGQ